MWKLYTSEQNVDCLIPLINKNGTDVITQLQDLTLSERATESAILAEQDTQKIRYNQRTNKSRAAIII